MYRKMMHAFNSFCRTRLLVMWAAVCLASNLCFAITYDVAADFSATNNDPNGVWKYGWSSMLTSALNLYDHQFTDRDIDMWTDSELDPYGYHPNVAHNGTGIPIRHPEEQITWQPGQFSLHPSSNGKYSHSRWTAPYTGIFDIAGTFTLIDETHGATDVYVLHNDTPLFNDSLNGFGDANSFSLLNIFVSMGEIIDFAVGPNGGNETDDTTALAATIIPIPEPATILLLGLGGIALLRSKCKRA